MCWATAGFGVIVFAVGFFAKNVSVFLAAVLPIAVGAFLTRHFEQKTRKLTRLRKRIRI
jgi:HAMP domain-containing protein